jgi:hypothetical protein
LTTFIKLLGIHHFRTAHVCSFVVSKFKFSNFFYTEKECPALSSLANARHEEPLPLLVQNATVFYHCLPYHQFASGIYSMNATCYANETNDMNWEMQNESFGVGCEGAWV